MFTIVVVSLLEYSMKITLDGNKILACVVDMILRSYWLFLDHVTFLQVDVKKTSPKTPEVEQKACSPPAQQIHEKKTSPIPCEKVTRSVSPACEPGPRTNPQRTSPIRPPSACTSPLPGPAREQKSISPAAITPKCTSPLFTGDSQHKETSARADCDSKGTSPPDCEVREKGTSPVRDKKIHKSTTTNAIQ